MALKTLSLFFVALLGGCGLATGNADLTCPAFDYANLFPCPAGVSGYRGYTVVKCKEGYSKIITSGTDAKWRLDGTTATCAPFFLCTFVDDSVTYLCGYH